LITLSLGEPPLRGDPPSHTVSSYTSTSMPTPQHLKAPFYTGNFYHLVCKSIDGLLLFREEADYNIFLHRFKKFMGDFLDVWAYCQLSNHTHQIVKVKSVDEVANFVGNLPPANKTISMVKWIDALAVSEGDRSQSNNYLTKPTLELHLIDDLLERQMNSFLVSYANYYNDKYNRKGGLFQKPFKRKEIIGDGYLQQAIIYTHANAQKHKLISDFKNHTYSSYSKVISNDSYFIDVASIQSFFGGKDSFITTHNDQAAYFYSDGSPSSALE